MACGRAGPSRSLGGTGWVVGVGGRDVCIGDPDGMLLPRGHVTQRVLRRHAVEAGEASDRRGAVYGGDAAEGRRDVLVPEQTIESGVSTGLVLEEVGPAVVGV